MRGDFYLANDPNPPGQPWGEHPPPEPEGTTAEERARVVDAWARWATYRPEYRRTGDHVEVQINLHDAIWSGEARDVPGRPTADTYWVALQHCIVSWSSEVDPYIARLKAEGLYPYGPVGAPATPWWRRLLRGHG